ncbi:uncharacterized protein LOC112343387 isoform X2 [Selaginella moellendorffii]|uniref:uncharacterized protein LOC112343387 isoform X2 n=1 Tax=Selaginella moellendorffii TaxID=88036 RepID=UPI000D1C9C1A|nr:uncharacterized protein LOC112343387 isoform X2 [Selaginella moellendorffii]|eukprot:XP_024522516.1 uncharacterized protein LOC112343387 isoform X2 [Selaginella moellendorffii]
MALEGRPQRGRADEQWGRKRRRVCSHEQVEVSDDGGETWRRAERKFECCAGKCNRRYGNLRSFNEHRCERHKLPPVSQLPKGFKSRKGVPHGTYYALKKQRYNEVKDSLRFKWKTQLQNARANLKKDYIRVWDPSGNFSREHWIRRVDKLLVRKMNAMREEHPLETYRPQAGGRPSHQARIARLEALKAEVESYNEEDEDVNEYNSSEEDEHEDEHEDDRRNSISEAEDDEMDGNAFAARDSIVEILMNIKDGISHHRNTAQTQIEAHRETIDDIKATARKEIEKLTGWMARQRELIDSTKDVQVAREICETMKHIVQKL